MCSNAEIIDIWRTNIETQKHFAELSLRMRQLGLTISGAILAIAVFLVRNDKGQFDVIELWWIKIPIVTILFVASAIVLFAAKIVDVNVYHKMLRGAVKFNEIFETKHATLFANVGLTHSISAYSRYQKSPILNKDSKDEARYIWNGDSKMDAGIRISFFYYVPILALLSIALIILFAAN